MLFSPTTLTCLFPVFSRVLSSCEVKPQFALILSTPHHEMCLLTYLECVLFEFDDEDIATFEKMGCMYVCMYVSLID